jgi:hypothetical protein
VYRLHSPAGNNHTVGRKRKARRLPNLLRSFLLQNIQTRSAAHRASYLVGIGSPPPSPHAPPGLTFNHSRPPCAEVNNRCSYTSVMDKDNVYLFVPSPCRLSCAYYFHRFMLRRCSQPFVILEVLQQHTVHYGVWLLLIIWRSLQIARL